MAGNRTTGQPLDLLFDARHIRQSGIGTYLRTQLPHLEETTERYGLSLGVLADPHSRPRLRPTTRVVPASPPSAPMYSPGEQVAWHRALRATRPRAVWLPHYTYPMARLLPRNHATQLYVTVHDTIQLLPEHISGQNRARRAYARIMLGVDGRACRRIFTVSAATKTALRGIVGDAAVQVTPIPVDETWFEPVDRGLSPVAAPYLLYVGNMKRYKNLALLLEAFSAIADTIPQTLVIAGGGASLRTSDDRVRELAERNPDRVRVIGQVDFAVLRALVASADMLVMPSLHEGAGLPPLEAMAAGTAVLSSSIPALRETCGDGAEYFDPHDRDDLIRLLRAYCTDDAARADLAARGEAHVVKRQNDIDPNAAAEAICTELARSRP